MIDIKEIRELCDKATPGPWVFEKTLYNDGPTYRFGNADFVLGTANWGGDAAFIAQSREVIPALLDELEAAWNGMKVLTTMVNCMESQLGAECSAAKQRWKELQLKDHPNAHAESVRYETLRHALRMAADIGQALENTESVSKGESHE